MMKHRIRKALLWLLMTIMVLFGTVGCGGSEMTAEQKEEVLQLAGEVAEALLEAAEETATEDATMPERKSIQTQETGEEQITDAEEEAPVTQDQDSETAEYAHVDLLLDEHGSYTSCEEVSLYIYTFGHLPENYITKNEAEDLGWNSKEGNLWDVAPGMSIGGNRFGNYEKLLPEKKGRKYYECDIDYEGGYRGEKRIIYSNDGLIFYTEDHYESFEQLY